MNPTEFGSDPATGADPGPDGALQIDVVSDVVCPWCLIGKRQLEQAVSSWQQAHPQAPAPRIIWHPFQLNPDMPLEGQSRDDYLIRKFGHADVSRLFENVRRAAAAVGVPLKLDAITRQPNTLRAHALMQLALQTDQQQTLAEALFNAYFIESRDLTDDAVLADVAVEAGLDQQAVDQVLASPEHLTAAAEADQQARMAGVSGVPFFVFNQKIGVSGAQGVERLLMAINKATAPAVA